MLAAIILVAKFGTTLCFSVCYSSTTSYFPPQFAVLAFNISNFFARAMTFVSPQLAEIQNATPMCVFTGLSLISLIALRKLKPFTPEA
jgi:hypothetical protein